MNVLMKVTESGFTPSEVHARVGEPVRLRVKRMVARTCATSIEAPGLIERTRLPLGETVDVTFTPTAAGSTRFGCAMGLHVGGTLVVEE